MATREWNDKIEVIAEVHVGGGGVSKADDPAKTTKRTSQNSIDLEGSSKNQSTSRNLIDAFLPSQARGPVQVERHQTLPKLVTTFWKNCKIKTV